MTFFDPNLQKFPGLKLGWEALNNPKCSPIVLNASNEVAVESFLNKKIRFNDIYKVIQRVLDKFSPSAPINIDDVIEIDRISRIKSLAFIKELQ